MKKLIFAFIFLMIIDNSYKTFAMETSKSSNIPEKLRWEYKIGDSTIDTDGIPLWAKDGSSSKGWLICNVPQQGLSDAGDNHLWLKAVLPDYKIQEPAIFLMTYDKTFEVYLNDKLIFQFGNLITASDKSSPGSPWNIINLPDDYAGKTIYLRMHSLNKFKTGILGKFEIGPKSSFPERILKQDIDTVVLVGLFIFVGICSIAISLLKKINTNKKSFLYLGIFSVLTGFWLIGNTNIKQYFINAPVFWLYPSLLSLYLMPACFCLFSKSILDKKFASLLNSLATVISFYTLASFTGSFLRLFTIQSTMKYFHIMLALSITAITFMTIKSLFKSSPIERTFGRSFFMIYIFAIIDLIRWYVVITDNFKFYMQWAILLFIVYMTFSLLVHLAESENKLKVYSEEIRAKEEILNEKKQLLLEMAKYDKMRTDFFVNISHELRTPLNIIMSTLQLIKLYVDKGQITFLDTELPRHLNVMKQNCYRLVRLVNNVLDVSRIDSGYMDPFFEKLDIVAVIEDTTLSTVDYAKNKDIELCFDTNVEEKLMCFDQDSVERIMLNLLSNAVKFSKPGSTITVELHDDVDNVCISVRDTGIGMPQHNLQSIFERFVQVDKSLSRSQEGSGIGLSLVKSLVDIHKGTIIVESECDKGTTFIVTLPATLPQTIKEKADNQNISAATVEKVHIEFSDTLKL